MKNSKLLALNSQLVKERAEQAGGGGGGGGNCSQAVFMAYADLFDMDVELASKLASSFGGGMGRLREVCGTCTGMFMVASLAIPADNKDAEAKKTNYALVQQLAEDFRKENGSIICRELLGLDHKKDEPTPSARTQEYYKKRPCGELVYLAAEILGKRLMEI